MMKLVMRLLLVVLILISASAAHAEQVTFMIPEWENYTNKDGTGYYWDLLRSIYEYEGIEFRFKTASFMRSLKMVEVYEVDASGGVFKTPERLKNYIYPKRRISNEFSGILSLKENTFNGFDNLQGISSKVRGYDYSAWLPQDLTVYLVTDTEQAIRMLRKKRIRYHADAVSDIESVLKKLGENRADFTIEKLYTNPLYVIFTRDTRGQKMADIFDQGIKRLYQVGTLDRLREKYGIEKLTYDPSEF